MEIDSADKKNQMSSAQLWSNGTTCDYKKKDSASEATLVIFENLKKAKIFLGFLGIRISNIFFLICIQRVEEEDWSLLENPAKPWSKQNRGGAFEASKEENEVSQVIGLSLMTPPLLEMDPGNSVSKKRSYYGCRGGSSVRR